MIRLVCMYGVWVVHIAQHKHLNLRVLNLLA